MIINANPIVLWSEVLNINSACCLWRWYNCGQLENRG